MKEIMERLQSPFEPCEIEWRVGSTTKDKSKGMALAYVTNRAIQNRLDNIFGCFGWRNEFKEWKKDGQLCGISIWSDDRQEWITKWDGADNSNMEATKGGLSDSMKRAAYQWGIGRYLYKLTAQWMPLKQQGNSYVLAGTPKLPNWALPEGCVEEKTTEKPKQETKAQDNQIKKLFALTREKDLSPEQMKEIMQAKFNKTSSKELTKKEASQLIDMISDVEKEAS